MPSDSPSNSPSSGLEDPDQHNSSSSPLLPEQQQEEHRRSTSPRHPSNERITDEVGEEDHLHEDESSGYPVKRPRTPSSVPPMPVSRKLNVSTKIVKSTESLHVADIVTFGSNSQDRSPLRSKFGGSSTSGDQQFCLKWNSYQTNLSKEFDDLLQNESFVDVTLACDGHSVKAHKMVIFDLILQFLCNRNNPVLLCKRPCK